MTASDYQERYGIDPAVAECIASWEQALPPMIARKQIRWFLGGLVSPATLNAEDSRGRGPANSVRVGRDIVYHTVDLLVWLAQRKGIKILSRHLPKQGIARPGHESQGSAAETRHLFCRRVADGHI